VKKHWLALFALWIVACAWGTTFTMVKNILASIAPEPFILWRFGTAGLVLLIAAASMGALSRKAIAPGTALGLLVFFGYWAQTRALERISPSRSALLTGLYVVLVPFCDRALRGNRIAARAWIASGLAAIGTALLVGDGMSTRPSAADLLTIFCALCFALHIVLTAEFTRSGSPVALAAIQVIVVGVSAAPAAAFAPPTRLTGTVVAVIAFTSIVTTAAAFFVVTWGQARVTATEAAVMLSFEPVAAALTSVLWDHEPVTGSLLAGGGTILAAILLSQASPRDIEWP
jgi:drug/metabolite transporter (DMT)-like permease